MMQPLQPLRSHLDESCPGVGTERVFDCLSYEVNSPPVPTEGYRIPIREGLSYTETRYTHFRECNPYSYIYSYNLLCVLILLPVYWLRGPSYKSAPSLLVVRERVDVDNPLTLAPRVSPPVQPLPHASRQARTRRPACRVLRAGMLLLSNDEVR